MFNSETILTIFLLLTVTVDWAMFQCKVMAAARALSTSNKREAFCHVTVSANQEFAVWLEHALSGTQPIRGGDRCY